MITLQICGLRFKKDNNACLYRHSNDMANHPSQSADTDVVYTPYDSPPHLAVTKN